MRLKISRSWLLLVFLSILLLVGCPTKYAVLISTGTTSADDTMYHSEYWYDLVLMYKMLKENGFSDANIYVLYGTGSDFASSHSCYNMSSTITDMAVNKINVRNTFANLSTQVDGDDYLFVWWMGHGGGSGTGMCNLSMSIPGGPVSDTEMRTYMDTIISYSKKSLFVMTCHSGGMIDNFNGTTGIASNNTIVETSSDCAHSSYSHIFDVTHADFSYHADCALRELLPNASTPCNGSSVSSDSDSDGYISLRECYDYARVQPTMASSVQIADPSGIAATTWLKKSSP